MLQSSLTLHTHYKKLISIRLVIQIKSRCCVMETYVSASVSLNLYVAHNAGRTRQLSSDLEPTLIGRGIGFVCTNAYWKDGDNLRRRTGQTVIRTLPFFFCYLLFLINSCSMIPRHRVLSSLCDNPYVSPFAKEKRSCLRF